MNYYDIYSPHLSNILYDDIPSVVRAANSFQGPGDDIIFRSRPDTGYVVNRNYRDHRHTTYVDPVSIASRPSPYAPLYSTTLHRDRDTDYLDWHSAYPGVGGRKAASAAAKPRVFAKESKNNSGEGFITHDSLTLGLPAQEKSSRPYLNIESDPSIRTGRYSSARESVLMPEHKKEKPYFLQPVIPNSYSGNVYTNPMFPFKKYRSDFVPFAPYPRLYDSVKYAPNPDWSGYYGYRYRKSRFVCDPEEQLTSRSREIERAMRDMRFRELCKGVYSSSYEDTIKSKLLSEEAKDTTRDKDPQPPRARDSEVEVLLKSAKSLEAETATSEGEKQRKQLTLAEKRRRNETLAIGLTNESLLKSEAVKPKSTESSVKIENSEEKSIKEDTALQCKAAPPVKPEPAEEECTPKVELHQVPIAAAAVSNSTVEQKPMEPSPEPEQPDEVESEDVQQNEPVPTQEAQKVQPEPVEEPSKEEPEPEITEASSADQALSEPLAEQESPPINDKLSVTGESQITIESEDCGEPCCEDEEEEINDQKEPEDENSLPITDFSKTENESFNEPTYNGDAQVEEECKDESMQGEELKEKLLEEIPDENTRSTEFPAENDGEVVQTIGTIDCADGNDEVEIKIVTETSTTTGDNLPEMFENTTTKTVTKINDDGSETIETIITEYTTTKADDNDNTVVETKVTRVTIESKGEDVSDLIEETLKEMKEKENKVEEQDDQESKQEVEITEQANESMEVESEDEGHEYEEE